MLAGKFQVDPIQPGVAFNIETRHLIYSAKQMTGFYMKRNTGLIFVNPYFLFFLI